jgi:LIM domain
MTGSKALATKKDKPSRRQSKARPSKSRPQSPTSSTRSLKKQPGSSTHSRAPSSSSPRQRSKSSPWDDNAPRPSTAPSDRNPSFSTGTNSRKASTDDVPPLPPPSLTLTQPSLERAETAPNPPISNNNDMAAARPGPQRFATPDNITSVSASLNSTPPNTEPLYKSKRPPPIVSNIPMGEHSRTFLTTMQSPKVSPPNSATSLGRSLTKLFGRRRSQSAASKREIVHTALSDEPNETPTPPIPDFVFQAPSGALPSPDTDSAPNSAPLVLEASPTEREEHPKAPEDQDERGLPESISSEVKPIKPAEAMKFDFDWLRSAEISSDPPMATSIAERPGHLARASIDTASSYGSVGFTERTASSRSSPPPTDELARKMAGAIHASVVQSTLPDMPPPVRPRNPDVSADSPTDPCFVDGRLSPIPRHDAYKEESTPMSVDTDVGQHYVVPPLAPRKDSLAGRGRCLGLDKGICRGCSKPIMLAQKSVSSADGRLTGRYHKDCFVCWTCKTPFPTSEIYVHADHPYCAHHYHELEDSLCATCGKGIEGLYMETANVAGRGREKHHPQCLKCTTCRIQLKTDYFELSGKVYCERDAFRLASLPRVHDRSPARPSPLVREYISSGNPELLKGKDFPERRTTRLMTTT